VRRLLQTVFWLALAATLYFTLEKVDVGVSASDKTQHALTFGALTLLAATAYPHTRLWILAIALTGFGGLIEIVQPYFGRGRELLDWVADMAGIAGGLLIVWSVRRLLFRGAVK
jgi:VanZ family protein